MLGNVEKEMGSLFISADLWRPLPPIYAGSIATILTKIISHTKHGQAERQREGDNERKVESEEYELAWIQSDP